MDFTQTNIAEFKEDLEMLLERLEQKWDTNINITYSELKDGKYIIQIKAENEGNEQAEWNKYCATFGLKPEHYGKIVKFDGESFRLVGIVPSKKKYQIQTVRIPDGANYGMPAQMVKRLLGV